MHRSLRLVALALALALPAVAAAVPKAELWPRWQAHDPRSERTIDHAAWDAWLKRFVSSDADGVNRVAYGRVDAAARKVLDDYIVRLAGLRISEYARPEQMAYWINLYNALTVCIVLDRYPVESILKINISPGFFSTGPWGKKVVTVEGEALSLDDIEHRILRPIWKDARIHYVVNCASVGCPDLRREAYVGDAIDRQLTEAATAYVDDWRGAAFEDGALYVSSLYKWYAGDFGAYEREILEHMAQFAAPEKARRLRAHGRIDGYRYDWDLNGLR